MNTLARIFIVVNLLLGIAFLSVSSVLFAQQEKWKGNYNDVVTDLKDAKNAYADKLNKKDDTLGERDRRITNLEREVTDLENQSKLKGDQLRQVKADLTDRKK